ncbi:MAG: hypothetical protein HY289_05115 [Planctomycetes bacterium]|nr:hypothetical protein [Planctomycetota bacterium]
MSHPLHARFVIILPRIEAHAQIYFRNVRCPARRADQVAETIALAWKWFAKLEARGKDTSQFVSAIATYAAKAVKCGRRIGGMEKAKDAMNARTQQRQGFRVGALPDICTLSSNPLTEALADNTVTPPPDAAAFRVDFPRWLDSLPDRNRRLAEKLMIGERTQAAARRFRMSPARVSQLRRELHQDWATFHGESLTTIS